MTDLRARADAARDHPGVTCPASRHVQMMAELLWDDGRCRQMEDEPIHCAESMLAVCAGLWEKRAESGKAYQQGYTDALNDALNNGIEWVRLQFEKEPT